MMKKALKPVRGRIRMLRVIQGLFIGLVSGAAGCLVLTAVSFFTPIEMLWQYLLCIFAVCPVAGALTGLLLPVPVGYAARRADGCGLKERVRTALAFTGEEGAMHDLQRADAEASLKALPVKQALPVRISRGLWIPAIALVVVTGVLFMLPNPQDAVIRARETVRQALRAEAKEIEKAADAMEDQGLTEEERRELRRITGEMAQELRTADNKREALAKLDEKQKQIEKLQKDIQQRVARETSQALGSQSALKGLSSAMESGDSQEMQDALAAIQEMLESAETAKETAEQLAQAAALAPAGAAQQGLSSSAASASAGNVSAAMTALAGTCNSASAGSTGADISALMKLARAGVAQAGSGTGAGSGVGMGQSQGGGGGAGRGTTQKDAGYSSGMSQSSLGMGGTNPIQDKVGAYERIYDPTRLGGDNESSYVEGEKGEGESQQMQLGPDLGDFSGSVPYGQVIGQYQQSAAQAMRRTALPETMQDWVARYFDSLLD